jgi:tetratricopeptide (TPR) repeat protein
MNGGEQRAAAPAESGGPTPATLHQSALQHLQTGRHLDAQLCCEQALAQNPNHIDSLHLMGLLTLQARQYDHAIAWIERANRQDPKAEHLLSLGIALVQQGLPREAFKAFDAAVRLTPDKAEAWLHHGNALAALERPAEAVTSYQHALKLDPRDANAAYPCGALLSTLRRHEEALACFDLCDRLHPNHAAVLEQRGLVLHALERYEEALDANLRAHPQKPDSPQLCNNIGAALLHLHRYEEALSWFERTLALLPRATPVLISKAAALAKLARLDEAAAVYAGAKAIDPGNSDVAFLASELHLLSGDFAAGWSGREARWKTAMTLGYPNLPTPMWRGEGPIAGRTILLFADEGLGDTIQFARYIPMLAARGAKVILFVPDSLAPLMSGLSGVSRLLGKSDPLPAFDLHCAICSLPLAFETRLETIPSGAYLPKPADARVQAWRRRLEDRAGPRDKPLVGLVWSGNPKHKNDHHRSLRLQALSPLLDLDAAFVSLQKDPRPADSAYLAQTGIIDLTADLTDLAATAALVSCLDLVITVDTSIAHLAGALGCPTWVLLPQTPDWRWLLGRDDSPWYPSVRLFRQDARRDYAPVIARVREALQSFLSERSPEA